MQFVPAPTPPIAPKGNTLFPEYPKWLYPEGKPPVLVRDADEEAAHAPKKAEDKKADKKAEDKK
jgi:hypothetical protein